MVTENKISLWQGAYPVPCATSTQSSRGHTVVVVGKLLGSACLASRAARRIGSGLVTMLCEPNTFPLLSQEWPGTRVSSIGEGKRYTEHLIDDAKNAFLLGVGGGLDSDLKIKILYTLEMGSKKRVVIDGEGLKSFKADTDKLINSLHENCVIIINEKELLRLFPDMEGSKGKMTMAAAKRVGCVVVLKEAQTLIASPLGDLVENNHTSFCLSSGGTGDVLSGMVVGLMAQGMSAFNAATMAVWVHGDAGKRLGLGLIAEDIVDIIPQVLQEVFEK